jgi:hypothetical protein
MVVCQVASGFGLSWRHALYPFLISSAFNVVWRAVYALAIAGIDPERVRVEMLSQSLPLLMAFMICGLVLQRSLPVLPLALGGLGVASYVFSITRSAVFVIGAAGIGALLGLWKSRRMGLIARDFSMIKMRHAMAGAGALLGALLFMGVAAPFVFERWAERLFNPVGADRTSMDPSTLTRLAETKDFLRQLNEDPLNYLFGMGIGHAYGWDESYATELSYTFGNIDIFRSEYGNLTFPGHAIWTYALYSGGIIGLVAHFGFFVILVRLCWRAGGKLRQATNIPLPIGWIPFAGILAYLSASLTFNPFIERAAGIVLGFMAGFPQFIYRDALRMEAWRAATRKLSASESNRAAMSEHSPR